MSVNVPANAQVSGQDQPETKVAAAPMTKEEIASMITGTVTRQVKAIDDRFQNLFKSPDVVASIRSVLNEVVSEHEAAKNKKPPTDHEKLQSQLQTLENRLQQEANARQKAESESRKSKIDSGINSLLNGLDGREGRPALLASAREDLAKLLKAGHKLPSEPDLDESGNLVVKDHDGSARPLAEILSNGFFGEGHWALERRAFRGSGPHGVTPSTTSAPSTVRGKPWSQMVPGSGEYNMAVAEALQTAQGDPQRITAIMQDIQRQRIGG